MTRPSGRIQQLVGRVLDRPFPYGYFRIFITSHIPQSKSGEHLALLPFAPRFCFAYFLIVCALLPLICLCRQPRENISAGLLHQHLSKRYTK